MAEVVELRYRAFLSYAHADTSCQVGCTVDSRHFVSIATLPAVRPRSGSFRHHSGLSSATATTSRAAIAVADGGHPRRP